MQRLNLVEVVAFEMFVFGDVLRTDVGDVEEASRLRQIRRRFERRDRRRRVDRVDEHEIGVRLPRRVGHQFPEIAVVADAP